VSKYITFHTPALLAAPEGQSFTVAALDAIKASILCDYRSKLGRFCDCKFGVLERAERGAINRDRSDEQNGCCELMQAMLVLKAMTPAEWKRVVRRAFPERSAPKRTKASKRCPDCTAKEGPL
jgi:hypothetical protein